MMTFMACRKKHTFFRALLDSIKRYPKLNTNNKHNYAEDIYLAYNSSNYDNIHQYHLHVETNGTYFFPTFDPLLKSSIQEACRASASRNMEEKFRHVCEYHMSTKFSNKPSSAAYTNHYWVHLNGNDPSTLNKHHVNLKDNLKITTRMMNISEQLRILEQSQL